MKELFATDGALENREAKKEDGLTVLLMVGQMGRGRPGDDSTKTEEGGRDPDPHFPRQRRNFKNYFNPKQTKELQAIKTAQEMAERLRRSYKRRSGKVG